VVVRNGFKLTRSSTYTVYNERANPETGVLLTTTLEPGVTFASSSAQPDQNGQELAWSLGMLNRFDRVSVSLANPTTTLQLDSGARAFGTLDATAVSDDILPRMRREGGVVSGR